MQRLADDELAPRPHGRHSWSLFHEAGLRRIDERSPRRLSVFAQDMLQHHDDGGGCETCTRCGALAVGPCARCQAPVCGDCCVLTEGGVRTFAICLGCERGAGRSLKSAWLGVIGFILLPIVGLAVALVLLALLVR